MFHPEFLAKSTTSKIQPSPNSRFAQTAGPDAVKVKFNNVLNWVYELPFGRGRRMGNNWNRGMDAVAGGWEMAGIFS